MGVGQWNGPFALAMRTTLKFAPPSILAILAHLGLLLLAAATAEAQGESPDEIIRFLTYQTDRSGKLAVEMGLFGCGGGADDRAAEESVVRLGGAAGPELETALVSLESSGDSSPFALNAGWLPVAYAKIKGRSASDRLLELEREPQLAFLRASLQNALSISLSLTSYISSSTHTGKKFLCRDGQPRDALDGIVLGWLRNDRQLLDASLSARSKTAVNELEKRIGWSGVRAQLWKVGTADGAAIGYRLSADASWSLPDDTLIENQQKGGAAQHRENPVVETRFVTAAGNACGQRQTKFVSTREDPTSGRRTYLLDESDIEGLLRLLSSCAASN